MAKKFDPKKAAERSRARSKKKPRLQSHTPPRNRWNQTSVSLYDDQLAWLKGVEQILKHAGHPSPNRSYLLQHAVRALADELDAKTPEQILAFFLDRDADHLKQGKPPLMPPASDLPGA